MDKDEAIKLALDVLRDLPGYRADIDNAITACEQALAQPAQRKLESTADMMMELADRLGELPDDIDPRAWSHLLVYAPEAQRSRVWGRLSALSCDGNCQTHQGDVIKVNISAWGEFNYCQEAIKEDQRRGFTVTLIKAQPEQEPVGVVQHKTTDTFGADYEQVAVFRRALDAGTLLYTTPPATQRKPLTDVTIKEWAERHEIKGVMTDLRCMAEDAETLYLLAEEKNT